jgi:hypothetical protein
MKEGNYARQIEAIRAKNARLSDAAKAQERDGTQAL